MSETPCRIGIDGMNLAIPRGTGVATYARSLSACLAQMGHPVNVLYGMHITEKTRPAHVEFAFFDQLQNELHYKRPRYPSLAWGRSMLRAWRGVAASEIPITGRVESRPFLGRLPAYDRILNVDRLFGMASHYFRVFGRFLEVEVPDPPAIMHWTYPIPARVRGARNVYTVHDLVPLVMPYSTLDHKPTHFRLLAACLEQGDHVCTVSESSRNALFGFFPTTPPDRVTNTYQAVQPPRGAGDRESDALVQRGYGLETGRYFLFFGSIEPKKNVARLLQAYAGANVDIPLVLVTARAWQSNDETGILNNRAPSDTRVRIIEYVTTETLAVLVRGRVR